MRLTAAKRADALPTAGRYWRTRLRRFSIAFGVTAALLAGSGVSPAGAEPPAQASARPCVPARGLVVAMTIRRNLKDGSRSPNRSPTAATGSRDATPRGARDWA